MPYTIWFLIKDLVIVLFLFALIGALRKINALKEDLEEEKRKRSMPLLGIEVDTDNDYGVFLINESYCYARNIQINDLEVTVDYGFKKRITLKFDKLDMLKPNGRTKVNYRVFDDEYDTTTNDAQNILNHFSDTPITIKLNYENLEGGPFASTIIPDKEKNVYVIKDVTPLKEEVQKTQD